MHKIRSFARAFAEVSVCGVTFFTRHEPSPLNCCSLPDHLSSSNPVGYALPSLHIVDGAWAFVCCSDQLGAQ